MKLAKRLFWIMLVYTLHIGMLYLTNIDATEVGNKLINIGIAIYWVFAVLAVVIGFGYLIFKVEIGRQIIVKIKETGVIPKEGFTLPFKLRILVSFIVVANLIAIGHIALGLIMLIGCLVVEFAYRLHWEIIEKCAKAIERGEL